MTDGFQNAEPATSELIVPINVPFQVMGNTANKSVNVMQSCVMFLKDVSDKVSILYRLTEQAEVSSGVTLYIKLTLY